MRLSPDAFALGEGPTRQGLSHMGFHAAYRIVSCSVFMLTRFPTICDYRQDAFALLQGPTQLACWTFSCPMRQFLNAFPLREGGGQRPGWMCLIEAQICAADSSFSFLRLSHKSPYRFEALHPAPLARPFSKGLLAETIRHWLSYRRRLTICLLFSQSLRRCAGVLLRGIS